MSDRIVFTRIVYDAERRLTSPCWKAAVVRWIAIMLSAPAVTACGQALDNGIPRRSHLTVVIDEMQRKNSLNVVWFSRLTYQVIVYFDGDCRIERVSASLMPEDGIFWNGCVSAPWRRRTKQKRYPMVFAA